MQCLYASKKNFQVKSEMAKDVPKYLSEFIGTYILVLTVGCNVLGGASVW